MELKSFFGIAKRLWWLRGFLPPRYLTFFSASSPLFPNALPNSTPLVQGTPFFFVRCFFCGWEAFPILAVEIGVVKFGGGGDHHDGAAVEADGDGDDEHDVDDDDAVGGRDDIHVHHKLSLIHI